MLLTTSGRLNDFVQFVTVLFIFIAVLGLTYLTTKWTANFQKSKLRSRNIEVIESFRLTTNKYLQIVRVGDRYLALALGKDSVTMLAELTAEEVKLAERDGAGASSFKEILEKAKSLKPKK